MKRIAIIAALVFSYSIAFAQPPAANDTKAKGILDQVSVKNKAYKTIYAEVSYSLSNGKGVNNTKNLKVYLKGNKYHVNTGEQIVVCDGKNVWKYFTEQNEADWTEVDATDKDAITPQNMFTIYQTGFKYKFIKEETPKGGKAQYIIELYPLKPKEKDYTLIKLFIDKGELRITKAEVAGRNGSSYTYKIKVFTPNKAMDETMFTFSKAKYPGVTINDLRD